MDAGRLRRGRAPPERANAPERLPDLAARRPRECVSPLRVTRPNRTPSTVSLEGIGAIARAILGTNPEGAELCAKRDPSALSPWSRTLPQLAFGRT